MLIFFANEPSWDQVGKILASEGLAFWRVTRDDDGDLLVDLSEEFLAMLAPDGPPSPGRLHDFLAACCPDQAGELYLRAENALAGSPAEFDFEHQLEPSPGRAICLRSFGRTIVNGDGGRAVIYGFSRLRPPLAADEDNLLQSRHIGEVGRQMADIAEFTGGRIPGGLPSESDPDFLDRALIFITAQLRWFKAVLDSLPFPVSVFDPDGRWTYLNQLSAEAHGRSSIQELLGRRLAESGENTIDSDVSQGGPNGEASRFTRYIPGAGLVFYGRNASLRDAEGTDIGRIETMFDVTDVHETNDRTRIMLDAMPLACNFWDEQFHNIDCNQAAAVLFDLPDKQAYLDNFFKLSPEFQPNGRPSAELAVENITKAFRDGVCIFEWMHQKLDGTPIPSEITLVRVARRDSFIVAGYTRDLRELKHTQAERDMERQLLRKIMDSSPVCFIITVDGVIQFITPFARNLTGRRVGDQAAEIYVDQEHLADLSEELDQKKFVNWRQVEIRRSDGQMRSMLLNAFKTDYYDQPGVMSWLMDITDLKDSAQELQAARDAAEESTRAKSEFLANMSHEIRTPMNAILGLIHLVLQTEMSDVQREYLQKTEGAAKTLLRIINDILDFSKIEAGKLEMEQEEFHLADVLQNVVDLIVTRAHDKGLEFLLLVPSDTPAGLVGDQVRLAQVLSNLATNAVKFTERGQVTLKVETVSESPTEVKLRFLVQDTGIGLSPDQVKNLFNAFAQAELSTTRRYGGTGLGLAISKRLVEMMGGEIWCESRQGQGSTFGFTAVFGLHASSKRYVSSRKDFRGLSALAVDDNVVALEILHDFLQTLGFSVVTAKSGREALAVLNDWNREGRHFDLVFIDWKMPDMDGIETSNRIHQIISPAKLPVIIMTTAYNRDDVLGLARESGIRNVMTKPLSPSTMLNVLVDIFGRGLPEKSSKLKKAHEMAMVKEYAGARILLAEDNEVNQLVASRILKNAGLKVEIANNGLEAVKMVKENDYDMVLMDIQMPEMDGIAATREIRSMPEYQDLPIVAMTAHAMSGDRELSLKAGMNDHINKPINLQELFSSLARWLRKKPKYE